MSSLPPPGLLQCYWVLPGRFLAGEYPAHMDRPQVDERLEALLQAGIDTYFDLTEPHELESYFPPLQALAGVRGGTLSHRRFPMPDFGLPTSETMRLLLDEIDAALEAGHNIYVHCWGGIGRTGMTVGCYLVRHGRSGTEALAELAALRLALPASRFHARSPETAEQVEFVKSWPTGASLHDA